MSRSILVSSLSPVPIEGPVRSRPRVGRVTGPRGSPLGDFCIWVWSERGPSSQSSFDEDWGAKVSPVFSRESVRG